MTANETEGSDDCNASDSTDGGETRRQFLGAAGAVAALPAIAAGSAEAAQPANDNPLALTKDGYDVSDYGSATATETIGHLEMWLPDTESTQVIVQSNIEAVTLKVSAGSASMQAMLLPEDVDDVCRELQEAKAKVSDAEAEEARDYLSDWTGDSDD